MLFASVSLAARIERAECRLLADCATAVARRRGVEVLARPIAGGIAIFTVPGSPLNKVAGLGFGGTPGDDELAALEDAFDARKAPLQAEVASLADPGIVRMLARRGWMLTGFEDVLGLALEESESSPAGSAGVEVEVERGAAVDGALWLETVVTGFATPDGQGVTSHESFAREVLEETIRDMTGAPGFARYLARRGGLPAGGASLRIDHEIAQLCGASTVPEHRRRGVQGALLAARLRDARAAGAEVAVTTTLPGSQSQENARRRGFEPLYTRAILVREPR